MVQRSDSSCVYWTYLKGWSFVHKLCHFRNEEDEAGEDSHECDCEHETVGQERWILACHIEQCTTYQRVNFISTAKNAMMYSCGFALMPPWRVCDVRCARSALGLANAENAVTALPKRMQLPDYVLLRSVVFAEVWAPQACSPTTKRHHAVCSSTITVRLNRCKKAKSTLTPLFSMSMVLDEGYAVDEKQGRMPLACEASKQNVMLLERM